MLPTDAKKTEQKPDGVFRQLIQSVLGVLLPPERRRALASGLPRTIAAYERLSERCQNLIEHPRFDAFILFCIVLVGFATFVEMEFGAEDGTKSVILAYVQQVDGFAAAFAAAASFDTCANLAFAFLATVAASFALSRFLRCSSRALQCLRK